MFVIMSVYFHIAVFYFKFARYFQMPRNNTLIDAPIIKVEKSGPFTVSNFYLDDLKKLHGIMVNCIHSGRYFTEIQGQQFC